MPTSGHTMGEMRHPATLGCQRGQKAAPERLSEVGLSTVQSTSLHTAAAPFSSPFAFALLDEQCALWDLFTDTVALLLDLGLC